jgi:tryptophanyl-tRNA synthetase
MSKTLCPNIQTCRLVTTGKVVTSAEERSAYIVQWCRQGEKKWSACKRFIAKQALGFCPDFVLPCTSLDPDGIIEKFDEINQT